jgi:hypothetical protein
MHILYIMGHNVQLEHIQNVHTVKPAHAVTSIKQSPLIKAHIFLVLSENLISIEPLLRGRLS